MDRWKQTESLFESAVELPAADRDAYLRVACGDDVELYREVSSLLAHHDSTSGASTWAASAAERLIGPDERRGRRAATRLAPGTMLGPYRVDELLGAGGMGDVYKATDMRLGRTVALKILPRAFSKDSRLRSRFEREARAVAVLHHPNICVLHDIGREGDVEFLVMEYLEGETLAARLGRGALSRDETIRYAIQIAEALSETHAQGIVHRDLKPGNIMLTNAGAKLLDFGLATDAVERASIETGDAGGSASVAGTVAYMAPEQLRGQSVDDRTDVYGFGAVLYEMIAGAKAFPTRPDRVSFGLDREAPALPTEIASTALGALVRRCLEKAPADRWPTARAIVDELRAIVDEDTRTREQRPARIQPRTALALFVLFAILSVGLVLWSLRFARPLSRRQAAGAGPSESAPLAMGTTQLLTAEDQLESDPAISPDGQLIAYAAGTASQMRVFVRPLAGGRAVRLSDDVDAPQFQPRWSPDGRQILFVTTEGAFVTPASGGAARRVDHPEDPVGAGSSVVMVGIRVTGATWSPDGQRIAITYGGTVTLASLDGRQRQHLPQRAPDELYACDWSPDGKWLACAAGNWQYGRRGSFGNVAPSAILLVPLSGGPLVEITDRSTRNQSPVFSTDGRLLYFVSTREGIGDIYAAAMSPDGPARSQPVRVTTGLGAYAIALSANRQRLAYAAYSARGNIWSVPIPAAGPVNISNARPMTRGNQVIEAMSVSPDGKWLLYDSTLRGNADIFRMPIDGGEPEPLTVDPAPDFAPEVSTDGRMLAFHSWRTGTRDVFVQPLDGGPLEQVTNTPAQESYPTWIPNSQTLMFFDQAVRDGAVVGEFVVHRGAAGGWGMPERLPLPRDISSVTWLPGGKALVYSRRSGAIELAQPDFSSPRVLYQRRPDTADPFATSTRLSDDGRQIYFKSHDADGRASFWAVAVDGGSPRHLVEFDDLARPSSRFDFAAGKGRFFFTIDERRSSIWVAAVVERP